MEDTQESGVESVESAPSSEPQSPAEAPQGEVKQEATPAEKPTPFHEHPRFKEIIEQNRSYKQELEGTRSSVAQLQAQLQQLLQEQKKQQQANTVDPRSKVLERLKGIDPEFAEFQSEMYKEITTAKQLQQELQELRQWKEQQSVQAQQQTAESQLKGLYEQHKVPDSDRMFYEAMITKAAMENPQLKMSDLPNLFKQAHENFTKYNSERERKIRESYVVEKKKDATPAPATGGTAASSQKGKIQSTEDRIAFVTSELRRAKQKI